MTAAFNNNWFSYIHEVNLMMRLLCKEQSKHQGRSHVAKRSKITLTLAKSS